MDYRFGLWTRTHHIEKTAYGHLSGQALTFGAFTRFDPEKRGWLGPGFKTLKPRSFLGPLKRARAFRFCAAPQAEIFWEPRFCCSCSALPRA